jgi:hypothetical protein
LGYTVIAIVQLTREVLDFVTTVLFELAEDGESKLIFTFFIVAVTGALIFTLSTLLIDFSKKPNTACVLSKLFFVAAEPACTAFNESLL